MIRNRSTVQAYIRTAYRILIVLVISMALSSCEKEDVVDFNFEYDLHIGIIEAVEMSYVTQNLVKEVTVDTDVMLISNTSGIHELEQFDLIYLPTSWAEFATGSLEQIEARAQDYLEYVRNGGNLLVEQPNPYGQPGDSITPKILPFPITFHCFYNSDDYPPLKIDTLHELTSWVWATDLPFPADQVTNAHDNYHVLVRGRISQSPSLLLTSYGSGRILIITAKCTNIGSSRETGQVIMSHYIGYGFFQNMILWLLGPNPI